MTNVSSQSYQTQQGCSVTTGGPDYHIVSGLQENSLTYFRYLEGEKASKEWTELYKSGTTPVMTLFYNEPWNNVGTGPAPFLNEPEVHMSCLRTIQPAGEESGSVRLQVSLGSRSWVLGAVSTLVWLCMVI